MLPVVLELPDSAFCSTSVVAAPSEVRGEKLADVIDPMVVQPVDHRVNDAPRVLGPRHVRFPGQKGLFGSRSFHHSSPG